MRSLDDTVGPAAAPAPAHPPPGVPRPRPAPGHAPRPRPRRCQGVAEGAWPGGADEVLEIIITTRPEINFQPADLAPRETIENDKCLKMTRK